MFQVVGLGFWICIYSFQFSGLVVGVSGFGFRYRESTPGFGIRDQDVFGGLESGMRTGAYSLRRVVSGFGFRVSVYSFMVGVSGFGFRDEA